MKSGSVCEKGRRPQNQDGVLCRLETGQVPLVAVSDGMGGHLAGDAASALSLQVLNEATLTFTAQPPDALASAYKKANEAVLEAARQDVGKEGMGATLVSALLYPDHFITANTGDSRLYLLEQGHLRQITHDHSYVQELVRMGIITEEQAMHHPKRNLITRCIGSDRDFEPDLFYICWQKGDLILLCSDGLSGVLPKETMEEILLEAIPPQKKCRKLVDLAYRKGSTDNITVLIVENDEELSIDHGNH